MTHLITIENCVKTCFGGRFGASDLATPISKLGVDSLDLVDFVMAVEEEFDVEIEADHLNLDKGLDQFVELLADLDKSGRDG